MVGRAPDILHRHQIWLLRGCRRLSPGTRWVPKAWWRPKQPSQRRGMWEKQSRKMHGAPKPWAETQIPQNSTAPGITAQPGQGGKQQHPKKRPKSSWPPHPRGGKSGRSRQARAGGGEGRAGAVAARGRRCRGRRGRRWLVLTGWPLEPGGRSCLGRRVAEAPD